MADRVSRVTFRSPDIWLGEFRLPPGHPAWRRTNAISNGAALIAFPTTSVRIIQEGRQGLVADPMRAVLYGPGQPYRRELVAPEGDRCSFISFGRGLAAEVGALFDGAAGDPATYLFPFAAAPIGHQEYLSQQHVRRLVRDPLVATDELRERLYRLIERVVASGYRSSGKASLARGGATAHAHAHAVECVRTAIGRDLAARLSLDDLASSVSVSPFHLSRIFRQQTGQSIHAYRTEVRLRASLAHIADGERLADVALDLGFASHAHLTDRFRRVFGVTPNAWRASLARNGAEMSRIMEARPRRERIA